MKQLSNEEFSRILKQRYPKLAERYPNLDEIIRQLGGPEVWDLPEDIPPALS